jgi:hypothetical protein
MKRLQFTLRAFAAIVLAFVMSSASCDLFQNADAITFTAVLDHSFVVDENDNNPNGKEYATKPADEVLDAATVNAEFKEHADKIESIKINKVTYVLSGYNSTCANAVGFSQGKLTFSDPDATTTTGTVIINLENANLKEASTAGTVYTITVDQAAADEMARILKEKKKIRVHASGRLSCTPLDLKVDAKIDCTITARVL